MTSQEVAKLSLKRLMSDISEEGYCAGWLYGLEYSLWDCIVKNYPRFGYAEVNVDELKSLADMAGGWWKWSEEDTDEYFVPMDEWLKIYEARK